MRGGGSLNPIYSWRCGGASHGNDEHLTLWQPFQANHRKSGGGNSKRNVHIISHRIDFSPSTEVHPCRANLFNTKKANAPVSQKRVDSMTSMNISTAS